MAINSCKTLQINFTTRIDNAISVLILLGFIFFVKLILKSNKTITKNSDIFGCAKKNFSEKILGELSK